MDTPTNYPNREAKYYEEPTPIYRTARNVVRIILISFIVIMTIQLFSHDTPAVNNKKVEPQVVESQVTGTVITGTTSGYHPDAELTGYELDITMNQQQQTRVLILDSTLQRRRRELASMIKDIDANIDINNKQLVALRAKSAEISTANYYTGDSFQ